MNITLEVFCMGVIALCFIFGMCYLGDIGGKLNNKLYKLFCRKKWWGFK